MGSLLWKLRLGTYLLIMQSRIPFTSENFHMDSFVCYISGHAIEETQLNVTFISQANVCLLGVGSIRDVLHHYKNKYYLKISAMHRSESQSKKLWLTFSCTDKYHDILQDGLALKEDLQ